MKHNFRIGDFVADVHPGLKVLLGVIIAKLDLDPKFTRPYSSKEIFWVILLKSNSNVEIISPESALEYLG